MDPVIYSSDDHALPRNDIDPDALKIMERLTRNGYKAHLVGGGVRDLLIGKQPKDFDIATDATPRRIKSLFSNSRIIGRRFKLVHVYFVGGKIIEVSTFRDLNDSTEGEGEEGLLVRNDNKFGTEETDALRRDITINGLFYDGRTRSIIDYVGGMDDLRNGIVRVIGDPDTRFAEDPVRLIRVVRHAARTNFKIEMGCVASIERNRQLILDSSPVRVYEEVKKDLGSGHSLPIMRLLSECGLLDLLLPEVSPTMLSEESLFSESIGRIDELLMVGEAVSTTLTLATIALFSRDPADTRELTEIFADEAELLEHLTNCFSSLTVPRKERERIEGALLLWFDLIKSGVERDLNVRSSRLAYLDDVAMLLRILPATSHDRTVFRLIEKLRHSDSGSSERGHRSPRMKRSRFRRRRGKQEVAGEEGAH